MESASAGFHRADARSGQAREIPPESLNWVDWRQAYLDLLAYKERRGWKNLLIRPETLRAIVEQKDSRGAPVCALWADAGVFSPQTFNGRALLQQAVTQLLCRYADRFYQARREQWEAGAMIYVTLDKDHPNLAFNQQPSLREPRSAYIVRVSRSEEKLIEGIKKLQQNLPSLRRNEWQILPRLYFDRHIYIPLLLEQEKIALNPPGLNRSEEQFVRDLRAFWSAAPQEGREIFLLRNLSRGRGIGFFQERGFYPDFILWIVDSGRAQRIVFIEPHGMLHAKAYIHDEKARLWEWLPDLARQINQRSGRDDISLDAFIISATRYDDLYQHYDDGTWDRARFAAKHILFPERSAGGYDYMRILFGGRESASDAALPGL